MLQIQQVFALRLISNSMNNDQNGGSPNLRILIGIPSLDNPMTNLPPKNGWNSLQPPKTELKGHKIQGCHEISVMSQIFKLLSWPHITSKYGVSYTDGKV